MNENELRIYAHGEYMYLVENMKGSCTLPGRRCLPVGLLHDQYLCSHALNHSASFILFHGTILKVCQI